MKKEYKEGSRGALVTVGILLFCALLLYTLWGNFGYTAVWGIILASVFVVLGVTVIRFTAAKAVYMWVGNEMIIRFMIFRIVVSRVAVDIHDIVGIGRGKKIGALSRRLFCTDYCASLRGSLFDYTLIVYRKGKKTRKLKFEPSSELQNYLRQRLSDRYYGH